MAEGSMNTNDAKELDERRKWGPHWCDRCALYYGDDRGCPECRLESENRRLREALGQLKHIDAHGCIDGDCPHEHSSDCVTALSDAMEFAGASVRAVLKGPKL